MATGEDKGVVCTARNAVRQTTGALRGKGPWHSANSAVYHNNHNCRTGNSIKTENVRQGTGGKPLCEECERLGSAGGPIGNLASL